MPVLAIFTVKGTNLGPRYDALMAKLPSVHPGRPQMHACATSDDGLTIVDVWESAEALQAFATSPGFIALRKEVGLPDPDVQVLPVHRTMW